MKLDLLQLGQQRNNMVKKTKKVIDYSKLRKKLQKEGEIPEWFTSGGTQLFYEKYSWENESVKSRFTTIANALALHAPKEYPIRQVKPTQRFSFKQCGMDSSQQVHPC